MLWQRLIVQEKGNKAGTSGENIKETIENILPQASLLQRAKVGLRRHATYKQVECLSCLLGGWLDFYLFQIHKVFSQMWAAPGFLSGVLVC